MRLVTPVRRAEPRRRCDRRALALSPSVNGKSGTMRQLDTAIAALRSIVSIAASANALARLSDEVRLLSLRVERLRGAARGDSLPALHQSAPASGPGTDASKAIGGSHGAKILQPFSWPARLNGRSEQTAAGGNAKSNKRGRRSVTVFETRPLLLVSGMAAILVAVFIIAMTMLNAVQPRVHVPAATGSHRIAGRQPSSFLISPVPIWSQSFNPATRDHTREASASLDALDQRRVSGR
jgi:hypothetical protein